MKILALDTSAAVCSASLCEDKNLISQMTLNTGNTHSETLLPIIEQILKLSDTSADDIDMFAATTGPGSFTGVRIGVATLKGMAFGKDRPCVGVSSLESLAYNLLGFDGIISPVMDARRDHVYNALFKCENGKLLRLCSDRLISVSELDEELSGLDGKIYLCGDAYGLCERKFQKTGICSVPDGLKLPRAYSLSCVALDKYIRGEYVSDFEIAPVYLRPSQAERERIERESSN